MHKNINDAVVLSIVLKNRVFLINMLTDVFLISVILMLNKMYNILQN